MFCKKIFIKYIKSYRYVVLIYFTFNINCNYLIFIWDLCRHIWEKINALKKTNNNWWKTPSLFDRRFTFCTQNGLVGDDVSEDTGLSSILWRIRSMPSEAVQKKRCVTSNVTAIRAPTYKEFVRKKKKSRKKKNPTKETGQLTLHSSSAFYFDTFPTTGRMILRFAAWSRNSCNI